MLKPEIVACYIKALPEFVAIVFAFSVAVLIAGIAAGRI